VGRTGVRQTGLRRILGLVAAVRLLRPAVRLLGAAVGLLRPAVRLLGAGRITR
jgi:hypothetical protein